MKPRSHGREHPDVAGRIQRLREGFIRWLVYCRHCQTEYHEVSRERPARCGKCASREIDVTL